MICEQALRMLRGEASQVKLSDDSGFSDVDKSVNVISIKKKYRAKPKKELVVPWKWISSDINHIVVDKNKNICHIHDQGFFSCYITSLKLDLEGIDLPVTVKRPEVK